MSLTPASILGAIEVAKQELCSTGDIQQAERAAWTWLNTIRLRPATMDDASMLLAWRNDPETREHSRHTHETGMESHLVWLRDRLSDRRTRLVVAEAAGVSVGTGRLDRGLHDTEISITVAPEHRGKGYARQIIRALVEDATANGVTVLVAQILATNARSLSAFIKEGFVPTEMVDDHNILVDPKRPPFRSWVWLRRQA